MSRRDTIIVAVLVNAGLLVVLFASALKSSDSKEEFAAIQPTPVQQALDLPAKKEVASPVGDEVDAALSQFVQNRFDAPSPVIPPQTSAPAPEVPNFADDLKVMGSVEAPHAAQVVEPRLEEKPAPEVTEVKVKKGDMLEKIARHHHTTVAEIMKANKLTNTNLKIGQVLKIPNKSAKKSEPSATVFSTGAKYYTVKKGDSPWTIAMKNHLKVEDLLKLNNMSEEQARRLKPGDQLRIQ